MLAVDRCERERIGMRYIEVFCFDVAQFLVDSAGDSAGSTGA